MEVILVHGYMGFPENCWFPWLTRELKKRGIKTKALDMPNPALPDRLAWQKKLSQAVKDAEHTILIGHSLGTAAILHYLNEYQGPLFAGVVLAAGFGRDFMHIAKFKRWFDVPLDFIRIKRQAKKWTNVHSKNDPLVPFKEGKWLSEKLGSHLIVENKGHLTRHEGAGELPCVLEAVTCDL